MLRAVIALPPGMSNRGRHRHLPVGAAPAVGQPDHGPVRMIDLSGLGDPVDVPREFAAWQRLRDDADPTVSPRGAAP